MTEDDDLVKRLRMADEYLPLGHDGWEAADRIEALEAKLEKALEALRRIANSQPRPMRSGGYEGHDVSNMQRTARATLAEIDGDKP
jgi:hypothetical protein